MTLNGALKDILDQNNRKLDPLSYFVEVYCRGLFISTHVLRTVAEYVSEKHEAVLKR